ncbi:MAG TPA: DUF721 domain-containing protein [Bacteroidia bacterium]|jgi:hypothetical protein|nr:DUF721 domain-containing protein [Bacteroidia bacterium]
MRNTNEHSLGELIHELINAYRLKDGLTRAKIDQVWEKVMDKAIVSRTSELRFEKGVLSIKLNSAVLRNELEYKKADIIHAVNKEIGEDLVKEVVLR